MTDEQLNILAARIASKSPKLDEVAGMVLGEIKTIAEANKDSGEYIDSLEIVTSTGRAGVKDRKVISNDPSAIAIEYGRLSGKRDAKNRRFMPGHFNMTRAAQTVRKSIS